MYSGTSTDISSHRKPPVVKTYCGNKPTVGCVRKPRVQATWFKKLGLGAISHGHWVITVIIHIVSDISLPSVSGERGSDPIL